MKRLPADSSHGEPLTLERGRQQVGATPVVILVREAPDGRSALELVRLIWPNAIFLDVGLPEMTGQLSQAVPDVVVVASDNTIVPDAREIALGDDDLEAIDLAKSQRAVDSATKRLDQCESDGLTNEGLWVPYRGSVVRLPIDRIVRIHAERDYVRIYDDNRSYLLRITLAEIARRLGAEFVRIHRSMIVVKDRIVGLRHSGGGSWLIVDCDGGQFQIGRTFLDEVRKALRVGD